MVINNRANVGELNFILIGLLLTFCFFIITPLLPITLFASAIGTSTFVGPFSKAGLAVVLLTLNIVNGSRLKNKAILTYYVFMVLFLIVFFIANKFDLSLIFTNLNDNYIFAFILPLSFAKIKLHKTHYATIAIYVITIIAFGLLQRILDQNIVSIENKDDKVLVSSTDFYGETRIFSLFSSPLLFGIFLGVLLLYALKHFSLKRWWSNLVMVLVLFILIYLTLTRVALLFAASVVLVGIMYKIYQRTSIVLSISIVLFLSIAVYNISNYLSTTTRDNPILSQETLRLRQDSWSEFAANFASSSTQEALFGTGVYQNSRFKDARPLDNTLLANLNNVGILGTLFLLISLLSIFDALRKDNRILEMFVASSIIIMFFNVFIAEFYLYLIVINIINYTMRVKPIGKIFVLKSRIIKLFTYPKNQWKRAKLLMSTGKTILKN